MVNVLLHNYSEDVKEFRTSIIFAEWENNLLYADVLIINDYRYKIPEYKHETLCAENIEEMVELLRVLCKRYPPRMRITVELPQKGNDDRLMSYFTDSGRNPPGYPKWKFTGRYDYII